jgi:hypothetical protein
MRNQPQPQPRRITDLDLFSRWALAVLVATALLTGAYAIIHAAAQLDEARTELSQTLPANYGDTLKAMLLSGGASCREVCGMTAFAVASRRTRFRVSCGTAKTADPCASSEDYVLTLEPSPVPSR